MDELTRKKRMARLAYLAIVLFGISVIGSALLMIYDDSAGRLVNLLRWGFVIVGSLIIAIQVKIIKNNKLTQ